MIRLAVLLVAGVLAPAVAGPPPWPAPPDPMALTRQASLVPETHEFLLLHVHAHLDVFVNRKSIRIPAGIGIDIHAPAVHKFPEPGGTTAYGGINPPCAKPCISPLHTHSVDGVLHTEAKKSQFNRLGQFFIEWKVRLSRKCVGSFCKPAKRIAVYVNGDRYSGDPRTILLKDRREIAIVIGKPPGHIPSKFP
jgi:hypothetical protein